MKMQPERTTTHDFAPDRSPRLRELTYRYQPKRDALGEPIRLTRQIRDWRDARIVLGPVLADEAVEAFGVLCLTTAHRVLCWHEVSRGCLMSTVVHPREVFKPAILVNAAAVLLAHNHPSGDPEPSADDIVLTERLVAAGALLGIHVLDHVVVADDIALSLRDTGRLRVGKYCRA
jgi:DNA repair protein RadC